MDPSDENDKTPWNWPRVVAYIVETAAFLTLIWLVVSCMNQRLLGLE